MDIIERLRSYAGKHVYESHSTLELAFTEAADEIERLREALKEILAHETDYEPYDCIDIARAALKESE